MIVLGPGSLYTSIMPNLVTEGVAEAIARSDAFKIYVLNVMTQDGETEGYTASDHIEALFSNSGEHLFDWCLANSLAIPEEIAATYRAEGAEPVEIDDDAVYKLGVGMLRAPVASWAQRLGAPRPGQALAPSCCASTARSPTPEYTSEED